MLPLSPRFPAALLSRIEDAGLNASAPPQQRWIDGWLVRYCPGKAKRARCINAVAEGRLPLADRHAAAAAVFREAELPLFYRLTPFTRPDGLDDWLVGQGMHLIDDTRVMVTTEVPASAEALPGTVTLARAAPAEFAEIVGALRGSPPEQRSAHAERMAQSPVPYQGWIVRQRDSGEAIACGQTATEGDMVGVYDVYTHPDHRGRGLARQLCSTLLAGARAAGARVAYLQVDAANAPARAIYHRLGFADAYGYHYRTPDADAH